MHSDFAPIKSNTQDLVLCRIMLCLVYAVFCFVFKVRLVPEALVGAYLHLSSTRPPREVLLCCLAFLLQRCAVACFGNPPISCLFRCGYPGGDGR